MSLEFYWNYKEYTIRAAPKQLVRFDENDINETIELVKWYDTSENRKCCYTLAYWIKGDEGYYLKFVGTRPFEDIDIIDIETIWHRLKQAQEVLDKFWQANREREYQ